MTMQATTPTTSSFSTFRSVGHWLLRVADLAASVSTSMACAREAERLMQMSDSELARRGLTRDRIVQHAFARYMAY